MKLTGFATSANGALLIETTETEDTALLSQFIAKSNADKLQQAKS